MKDLMGKFVKKYPEHYFAKFFSRVFWPPPTVTVLVHGENNDILALDLDGEFRLPGGFMDKGDELKQAGRREVKEETGFEVEITQLLDIRKNESGGPNFFFEGHITGGSKNSSWEGEAVFIDKNKVKDKIWKLDHSHVHRYLFPSD